MADINTIEFDSACVESINEELPAGYEIQELFLSDHDMSYFVLICTKDKGLTLSYLEDGYNIAFNNTTAVVLET